MATALVMGLLVWGLYGSSADAQQAPGAGGQRPAQAAPPAVPAVCGQMSTVPRPNPGSRDVLVGVSALASNDVWAVGTYSNGDTPQTLVEHWDGTAWSVVPSPGYASLDSVAALASNDVRAAGVYGPQTLVEHW